MTKRIAALLALLMVVGVAFAVDFTEVDTRQHQGKTGLKSLIVDIDSNFALIKSGRATMGGTAFTNTYTTAFAAGTTPAIVVTYSEDPGGTVELYAIATSNVGFVVTGASSKNFSWIAIGE